VDELDVGRIDRGQPAIVTLDAVFDQEFEGRVVDISPRPVTNDANAIVTYEVTLTFNTPEEGITILPGMTASANIETRQLQDVVVVPNEAIQIDREDGYSTMFVEKLDKDGNPVRVEIELGLQDETVTEVEAGLEEGDEIIIRGREGAPTSTPKL
jgi:multidrug efflux pump subunit AcrA (membrane-fusion protein)